MQLWDEIIRTALVGTERQPPPLPSGEAKEERDALAALLARLDPKDRERALLGAAGAVGTALRAGYTPTQIALKQMPEPAPLTDLPTCRSAATADLARMLAGEFDEALQEWLVAVAGEVQRVPDEMLPALLDRGRRPDQAKLKPFIAGVLGNRGRWLAAQNPEWKYGTQLPAALGTASEGEEEQEADLWDTGTLGQRLSVLARARRADPAVARKLLEEVWSQETYEARAALLKTLAVSLSMEDEPFLENALDDRRKEVRTVAQDLLCWLPDSRFGQRMRERSAALFTLAGGRLELTLPAAFDRTWQRDGIEQKPPHWPKIGEKTHWLIQIAAATPLDFWEKLYGGKPTAEQVARWLAAVPKDWQDTVFTIWRVAAQRQQEEDWGEAILVLALQDKARLIPQASNYNDGASWESGMSSERRNRVLIQQLERDPRSLIHNAYVVNLLHTTGFSWSLDLAKTVLAVLGSLKPLDLSSSNGVHALVNFAPIVPDEVYDEFRTYCELAIESYPYHRSSLEKQTALRQFRREMISKIKGS